MEQWYILGYEKFVIARLTGCKTIIIYRYLYILHKTFYEPLYRLSTHIQYQFWTSWEVCGNQKTFELFFMLFAVTNEHFLQDNLCMTFNGKYLRSLVDLLKYHISLAH